MKQFGEELLRDLKTINDLFKNPEENHLESDVVIFEFINKVLGSEIDLADQIWREFQKIEKWYA